MRSGRGASFIPAWAAKQLSNAAVAIVLGKKTVQVYAKTRSGVVLEGVAAIKTAGSAAAAAGVGSAVGQALADALQGRKLNSRSEAGRIAVAATAGALGGAVATTVTASCTLGSVGTAAPICLGAGIVAGAVTSVAAKYAINYVARKVGQAF